MTLARAIKKALFGVLLFICCLRIANAPILGSITQVIATYDRHCLAFAIHREARGEKPSGQRAVLAVIHNRMTRTGRTACQIVLQHGQFPWAKYVTTWQATEDMLAQLDVVDSLPGVLPKDVVYFRTGHYHKWGRKYKKIGNHFFSFAR